MVNLEWLNTFTTFARTMNFMRASEELHLSQPAVHLQVQKLQDALGVPLYRRDGRRLVLTEEGRRAAAFGVEMHERSGEFLAALHGVPVLEPVVLCAGEGAFLYVLGPAIGQFVKEGAVPLRLLTLDGPGTIDAVQRGAAHLGVAVLQGPVDGLQSQVLSLIHI